MVLEAMAVRCPLTLVRYGLMVPLRGTIELGLQHMTAMLPPQHDRADVNCRWCLFNGMIGLLLWR